MGDLVDLYCDKCGEVTPHDVDYEDNLSVFFCSECGHKYGWEDKLPKEFLKESDI